jgi:hypothetical protein
MPRQARWIVAVMLLLGFCGAARAQESYSTANIARVKMGKGAEFEALAKKLFAASRENGGGYWFVTQIGFGESAVYVNYSVFGSYGEMEKAHDVWVKAVEKSMGHVGMDKAVDEIGNCLIGDSNILTHARPDLSANSPSDPATVNTIVGNTRWARVIRIQVRPGQNLRFEELAKQIKAAQEKADPHYYSWVSESVAGESGGAYYVWQPRSSLADFDHEAQWGNAMGNDATLNLLKTASEVIASEDVVLQVVRPDLSNMPDEIANVAPDFWRPKPASPASMKAPAKN